MWSAVFFILALAVAQSSMLIIEPELNLDEFYTYDGMVSYLSDLSQAFSDNMIFRSLAMTHEKRFVYEVKVFNNKNTCQKNIVLLDAAIHGNEWITTTVALKAIRELLVNADKTDDNLLDRSDWYILPMVNPDGYAYSLKNNRPWVKNRSPNEEELGTNLNRNFDSNWNKSEVEETDFNWSGDFRGYMPFSEPESLAVADLMQRLVAEKREILYITLHTKNQSSIFYPFVFSGAPTNKNSELNGLAQYASEKILSDTNIKYNYDLPLAYKGVGGTSLDYAYQLNISMAFDLEFYQPVPKSRNLSSFIVNRTLEGWSGVFHLAEGALQNFMTCIKDDEGKTNTPPNTDTNAIQTINGPSAESTSPVASQDLSHQTKGKQNPNDELNPNQDQYQDKNNIQNHNEENNAVQKPNQTNHNQGIGQIPQEQNDDVQKPSQAIIIMSIDEIPQEQNNDVQKPSQTNHNQYIGQIPQQQNNNIQKPIQTNHNEYIGQIPQQQNNNIQKPNQTNINQNVGQIPQQQNNNIQKPNQTNHNQNIGQIPITGSNPNSKQDPISSSKPTQKQDLKPHLNQNSTNIPISTSIPNQTKFPNQIQLQTAGVNPIKNPNPIQINKASSAGELGPLVGVCGTLLLYLSYSLIN